MKYQLLLNGEVVDKVDTINLKEAILFFTQRKQMTKLQFDKIGYVVKKEVSKRK